MSQNPFPGPQPYRADDRTRFFRDKAANNLAAQIIANPVTTVYGPSGAGKSSLMQAGVIPTLVEVEHVRVIRVDAWPAGEAPLRLVVHAIIKAFGLDDEPAGKDAVEQFEHVIGLAAQRQNGPILLYLDQLEQLFIAVHSHEEMSALLNGLAWLLEPD